MSQVFHIRVSPSSCLQLNTPFISLPLPVHDCFYRLLPPSTLISPSPSSALFVPPVPSVISQLNLFYAALQ